MTTPSEPGGPGQEGQPKPFEPMPAAPALNEQELGPAAIPANRPKSVNTAFLLWLAVGGLLLLGAILLMAASDDNLRETAKSFLDQQGKKNPTDQEVTDAIAAVRRFGVGFNLLFVALTLVFAFPMRGGRNWARIGLCVVGGLLVVIGFFAGGGNLLFVLLQVILIGIAVYLMFRPDANQYFAARKVRV